MRVPTLRKHKTGQWFVRWGGRDRYLGTDKRLAENAYLDEIDDWRRWVAEKRKRREVINQTVPTIAEVVNEFLKAKRIEVGHACGEYYRRHLSRFLVRFGELDADLVRPKHLNALKLWMIQQRFKPRTINHDLCSIRILYNWASGLELVPPISLAGVRNVPVGAATLDLPRRWQMIRYIRRADAGVRPWMAVNYLALLRPSEVVRVVRQEGKWVEPGVFRLERGKMDKRVAFKRHCVFSESALEWLGRCEPLYSRQDSYSWAVRKCCPIGPKLIQKSAAQHLATACGADRDDVELLLGHVGPRLKVTYHHPAWQRLRQTADRLAF